MTNGNNKRIPNTAMTIPTVKNICRQNGLIRFRIAALMMALSNDSDTSRTANTSSRKRSSRPPWAYPSTRATTVSNSETPKTR